MDSIISFIEKSGWSHLLNLDDLEGSILAVLECQQASLRHANSRANNNDNLNLAYFRSGQKFGRRD